MNIWLASILISVYVYMLQITKMANGTPSLTQWFKITITPLAQSTVGWQFGLGSVRQGFWWTHSWSRWIFSWDWVVQDDLTQMSVLAVGYATCLRQASQGCFRHAVPGFQKQQEEHSPNAQVLFKALLATLC